MKEVFEKFIERVEKLTARLGCWNNDDDFDTELLRKEDVLDIIHEEEKDYNELLLQDLLEAKKCCSEDSDCSECIFGQIEDRCILAELQNGTIDNNKSVNGDLISRSLLIDKLKKWKFANEERGYDTASDLVQEMIELTNEQPTAYNDGWIPCSSGKMPEEYQDIYISGKVVDEGKSYKELFGGLDEKECFYGYYRNGKFYGYTEDEVFWRIDAKAWQPLPEPYKPTSNSEIPNKSITDTWKQQTMSRFERVE